MAYIQKLSGLPVFAKGVATYDDTILALKSGIDGIFVSNHGARQLDTVPGTIEVLPEVAQAVKDYKKANNIEKDIEIFFDGGVKRGVDVFKALALGADAVFIGRPVLYGLACDGQKGVEKVLRIINEELRQAMLHAGCMSIADVKGNTDLLY